uniref:Uncharacterized protein n=1 Tax=Ceratitis capitata TaxID=7213 RepID=W8BCW2_CERCA
MRRLRTSTKAQTAGAVIATTATKSGSGGGGGSTSSTGGITPHADIRQTRSNSGGSGGTSGDITNSNSTGSVGITVTTIVAATTTTVSRQKHNMDAKLSGDVFKNFEKTGKSELYVTGNNKRSEIAFTTTLLKRNIFILV